MKNLNKFVKNIKILNKMGTSQIWGGGGGGSGHLGPPPPSRPAPAHYPTLISFMSGPLTIQCYVIVLCAHITKRLIN